LNIYHVGGDAPATMMTGDRMTPARFQERIEASRAARWGMR
jgi:hypothetical protein